MPRIFEALGVQWFPVQPQQGRAHQHGYLQDEQAVVKCWCNAERSAKQHALRILSGAAKKRSPSQTIASVNVSSMK